MDAGCCYIRSGVVWSFGVIVMIVSAARMAEPIELLFAWAQQYLLQMLSQYGELRPTSG